MRFNIQKYEVKNTINPKYAEYVINVHMNYA